jgi:hypothetical protein
MFRATEARASDDGIGALAWFGLICSAGLGIECLIDLAVAIARLP